MNIRRCQVKHEPCAARVLSSQGKCARTLVAGALLLLCACGERRFSWAFAQGIDNSINPNETCRQSLAESLYHSDNSERTARQGGSNIFVYTGVTENYRVYAYHSQSECETALNGMVQRQRK